jgi:hypothetical protein
MKFLDCLLKYIGQTGRIFHTRYKEHIQAIRNNNSNSGYSKHILNTRYKYGTIPDKMDIIKIRRKRKTLKHVGKIPHIIIPDQQI